MDDEHTNCPLTEQFSTVFKCCTLRKEEGFFYEFSLPAGTSALFLELCHRVVFPTCKGSEDHCSDTTG